MKEVNQKHANEYADAIKRMANNNPEIGRYDYNSMFWLSDYMVHNRTNYDFSVRAVSKKTCRSESGNGENIWGTYVSEGATNIRVDGDEYFNIFPVWEWDKIPGTTTPSGEKVNPNNWGVRGVADLVGGISDGKFGAMGYLMNDFKIEARKGWFMFDQEVVCLGAGIKTSREQYVNTSINQCNLKGDLYQITDPKMTKLDENSAIEMDYKGWIWHNKIGYYLPYTTSVTLKNTMQTGSWSKINYNQSAETVSLPVFNLSIRHGKSPQAAEYAYIVVPGMEQPDITNKYHLPNICIESNTEAIQAVRNIDLDMTQAIFYEAGTLEAQGYTLEAKAPCVLLIKGISSGKACIVGRSLVNNEKTIQDGDVTLTIKP